MLSPSVALVTERPDLDQSFEEYTTAEMLEGFVAKEAAPPIYPDKQSGNLGRITLASLLQSPEIKRAPRANYRRGTWTFEPETYQTYERGYEELVDDSEIEFYGSYMAVEAITAVRAKAIVRRDYEIDAAATLFNTTTFTGATLTAAAANKWDNRTAATIRDDVTSARNQVFKNSGLWPNAAIMSMQLFNHAVQADDFTTLVKYSGLDDPKAREVSKRALAQFLNVDKVIVAGQAKNTADEGQTPVVASLWDPTMCLVCRVCEEGDVDYRTPCVARTFCWTGDGASIDGTTESYPDFGARGQVIRVRTWRQVSLRYAELGFLITGCANAGG